ncbi:Protein kinase domain [Dillenia turbinata]|uniref:non-specific serine/threonine protein kinase n=1 Tax=Dillenia turbinata TaxID=194707 RepID=A0AAN8YZM0_9MAGN
MDISGQVKVSMLTRLPTSQQWNLFFSLPRQQCEVYAYCGPFGACNENSLHFCTCVNGYEMKSPSDWNLGDYSSGCRRSSASANGAKDKFLPLSGMKLPDNSISMPAETAAACEVACLNNFSCNAYAWSGRCLMWTGDLLDLQQYSNDNSKGSTVYVRQAPSSSVRKIVSYVLGSVGVILLFGLAFFLIWRKRRSVVTAIADKGSFVVFGYRDLQIVTKNFSEKLGRGGFGSVFKGTLSDSTVIAVKKLESIGQGEKQFRAEVSTIGMIQHVNLVRLRGFCSEGTKKLLVYDYLPNGSLDTHLFHKKDDSKVLDWKTRFQIALGIARGLAYLHEKCRDCIIHCDIKPENILLDADFCPKVADFGLAKLVGRNFSRVLTTIRGTLGYLAPEWISGRRNFQKSEDGNIEFFPSWAAGKLYAEEDILTILDPKLEGSAEAEELRKTHHSFGGNAISGDESLSGSQTIVSAGGNFVLGFFKPGRRNFQTSKDSSIEFFPSWAASKLHAEEDILTILDPKLEGLEEAEELRKGPNLSGETHQETWGKTNIYPAEIIEASEVSSETLS